MYECNFSIPLSLLKITKQLKTVSRIIYSYLKKNILHNYEV